MSNPLFKIHSTLRPASLASVKVGDFIVQEQADGTRLRARVTSIIHGSLEAELLLPSPLEQMAQDLAALGLWAELLAMKED